MNASDLKQTCGTRPNAVSLCSLLQFGLITEHHADRCCQEEAGVAYIWAQNGGNGWLVSHSRPKPVVDNPQCIILCLQKLLRDLANLREGQVLITAYIPCFAQICQGHVEMQVTTICNLLS